MFLGRRNSQKVQDKAKWRPDFAAVDVTIQFDKDKGKFEYEVLEGLEVKYDRKREERGWKGEG